MTPISLMMCLCYLHAAEDLLLTAEDTAAAAHLSLVIDRLRASYGLPERSVEESELERWGGRCVPTG